jgi:uncharacterized protein (DUF1778 family)
MSQPPDNQNIVRIDARIPAHIKESLAVAAALQGRTQTDFLITAVGEAARKVIAEHNVVKLCLEDQKALAAAILNDQPDMERFGRLRKAMREHARAVEGR